MKKLLILIGNIISLRTINRKLINLLWNECDIPISRMSQGLNAGTFYYGGNTPRIELSKHTNMEELYTTLLHEVGHYKDWKKHGYWYSNVPIKTQEKSAWKWAMRFAKQYELPMNYRTALESLGTYNTTYRCLEKAAGITYRQIQLEELRAARDNLKEQIAERYWKYPLQVNVNHDNSTVVVITTVPVPNFWSNK